MSEFKKFRVGVPATHGFTVDCMPFDSVSHTSHANSAISIIEAGEIRPSLVFDESILNDQRILVSWLSPNHWSTGYRYGNVRFNFSFNNIIQRKRYYWVESIAYKIRACRILITDINREAQLKPYDPTLKNGPWWFDEDGDQHYFNNNYCLEFMIEAPIKLDHLSKLDFVEHHPTYCSIHRNNPKKCSELRNNSARGGALFLTRAAAARLDLSPFSNHFVRKSGNPTDALEFAFSEFASKVSRNVNFTGSLTQESESGQAVARAIMSAFTFGSKEDAKLLCAMFRDEDSFAAAAAMVIGETLGLENWEKLVH